MSKVPDGPISPQKCKSLSLSPLKGEEQELRKLLSKLEGNPSHPNSPQLPKSIIRKKRWNKNLRKLPIGKSEMSITRKSRDCRR